MNIKDNQFSRRNFLKHSAISLAGLSLGAGKLQWAMGDDTKPPTFVRSSVIAGVTLCLKNLAFGAVNNTQRFHPSPYFCDPASAEICLHPAMRNKVRLHIVDALQACFDGGPASMKNWTMWNEERLFFGTDPVAIDRIGLEIIDKKRRENNCPSIIQKARHIATGGKLGLGIYERDNIDFVEISCL